MSTENPNENFIYDGFDLNDETIRPWDGEGGSAPNLAPGEYLFEVKSCTITDTKNKDGKNFVVTYTCVSDGPAFGEDVKQWYLCAGENFKGGNRSRIVQVFRNALKVPTDEQGRWETKNTVGRRMFATVTHETRKQYDTVTLAEKTFTNIKISCERPADDEQPPALADQVSLPFTKASSAPPSRPPTALPRVPVPVQRAR